MPVLAKAVKPDPEQRYESMDLFLKDLAAAPDAEERRQQRRKRWGFFAGLLVAWVATMVAASRYGRESSEGDRTVTRTEEAEPPTTPGDVDLRLAIDLAEAGRPFEAWTEVQRVDERGGMDLSQALDVAELLLRVAPALPGRQRDVAYEAAEQVATRVRFRARSAKDRESEMNRAVGLRKLAENGKP
ncbi:MAG: hypothetical protein HC927_04955 [Deltaproteobacteria bacterium]|nr:hypothetical protein [Deltaproteobacteria bacterium]